MIRILFLVIFFAVSAFGSAPIRSISEIRALPVDVAAKKMPVLLESQVVWVDSIKRAVFINDGLLGIYVQCPTSFVDSVKVGDIVRLSGCSQEGKFVPSILADSMEIIGRRDLPVGETYNPTLHLSPRIDCAWVSVNGRLVSMRVDVEKKHINARLRCIDVFIELQIPYSEESEILLRDILFEYVEFNAVAGSISNKQRQFIDRILFVNSARDFRVVSLRDDKKISRPIRQIHKLMDSKMNQTWVNNAQGVVLFSGKGEAFLRGEQSCLRVELSDSFDLKVGDYVYVEGFVFPDSVGPILTARNVEVVRNDGDPIPNALNLSGELDTDRNFDLIEIEAELIEIGQTFGNSVGGFDQQLLLCRAGNYLFEVRYPSSIKAQSIPDIGSILKLRGICHLIRDMSVTWDLSISGFWLQLCDESDVRVISPAPWWTVKKLIWILFGVLCLAVVFLIWVLALRKTVECQTLLIGKQIKQESTLNERQRIARELHDTMEQGLVALSLQLRSLCRKIQKDPSVALAGLAEAEHMLKICREESRASIQDLRGGLLEKMSLPEAIEYTLSKNFADSEIRFEVRVNGNLSRFDVLIEHQLLRLIGEAVTNAFRHSSANFICVEICEVDNFLTVSVTDDGCGFDLDSIDQSGHFGVRGMYERANRLNAELKVESTISVGTCVNLRMEITQQILRGKSDGC